MLSMDLGSLGIPPRIVLEIAALRLDLGTYRCTTCTVLYMYSNPILVSKMDSAIIIKPMHALLLCVKAITTTLLSNFWGGGGGVGNPRVPPPPPLCMKP